MTIEILAKSIENLSMKIEHGFRQMDDHFEQIDSSIYKNELSTEKHLIQLEQWVGIRFSGIESRISQIEKIINPANSYFMNIQSLIKRTNIKSLNNPLSLEHRISNLETHLGLAKV